MTAQRIASLVLLLGLAGCAGGAGAPPPPSPAEIPELEAALDAAPNDEDTGLRLAAAYREAGRVDDARAVVDVLLGSAPDSPGLTVMSGLLAEDSGDFSAAREKYEAFLASNDSGDLRAEVEARLDFVRAEELRADVRASLARENELAQTTPDPASVGIFPFAYDGVDPQWEPLGNALAELLITDLAITGRLRVLERVHIQALLDEMALADAGFVEASTAARSGRLLGSGRVVQGRYRVDADSRIGIDAAVVDVGPPGSESFEPVTAEDAIERLFDLEKQMALDLHAEMGIQLTPAERTAINERHTESVQALLAFGRGLAASDAGDYQAAQANFAAAADLDPSFALAQQKQQLAASVAQAGGAQNRGRLSGRATQLARQRAAVRALRNAPASVRQRMLAKLGQRQRAVLAEVLGQDRVGTSILLELVFRRPGGEQ